MKLLHKQLELNPDDDENSVTVLFTHPSQEGEKEFKVRIEIVVNDDALQSEATSEIFSHTDRQWKFLCDIPIQEITAKYKYTGEDAEEKQAFTDFVTDIEKLMELTALLLDESEE